MKRHFDAGMELYKADARCINRKGVCSFCAPPRRTNKIIHDGSARSWIHYINLRSAHGTQKEHMEIAELCKQHFICQFPTIAEALEWCPDGDCGCSEDIDYADCLQPSLRID